MRPASHFFMKLVFAAPDLPSLATAILLALLHEARLRGTGERFAVH
jgi:hypothetical protein